MKRIILGCYGIVVVLVVLIVSWAGPLTMGANSSKISYGYSLLFSPPNPFASVDYGIVILELVAITAIAGICYLFQDNIKTWLARNWEKVISGLFIAAVVTCTRLLK